MGRETKGGLGADKIKCVRGWGSLAVVCAAGRGWEAARRPPPRHLLGLPCPSAPPPPSSEACQGGERERQRRKPRIFICMFHYKECKVQRQKRPRRRAARSPPPAALRLPPPHGVRSRPSMLGEVGAAGRAGLGQQGRNGLADLHISVGQPSPEGGSLLGRVGWGARAAEAPYPCCGQEVLDPVGSVGSPEAWQLGAAASPWHMLVPPPLLALGEGTGRGPKAGVPEAWATPSGRCPSSPNARGSPEAWGGEQAPPAAPPEEPQHAGLVWRLAGDGTGR